MSDLPFLYGLPRVCPGNFTAIKKKLIQFQKIADKSNNRLPLLFTEGTDPVLEPIPVKGNDLEYECNAIGIEAIMRTWIEDIRMRESGTTHAAGQWDNNGKTVCTSHNYCRPDTPLFMSFCIG
jgi:hypothetical protein